MKIVFKNGRAVTTDDRGNEVQATITQTGLPEWQQRQLENEKADAAADAEARVQANEVVASVPLVGNHEELETRRRNAMAALKDSNDFWNNYYDQSRKYVDRVNSANTQERIAANQNAAYEEDREASFVAPSKSVYQQKVDAAQKEIDALQREIDTLSQGAARAKSYGMTSGEEKLQSKYAQLKELQKKQAADKLVLDQLNGTAFDTAYARKQAVYANADVTANPYMGSAEERRALARQQPDAAGVPQAKQIFRSKVETYQDTASRKAEADRALEGKEKRDKYSAVEYDANFRGQFRSNKVVGRLGIDANLAWNAYLNNPTAANKQYALDMEQAAANFSENNAEALNRETKLPWIAEDLAQYLPQAFDQAGASAVGGFIGGALGALAAGPAGAKIGAKAGIVAASGMYSYDVARGAAFRSLRELGVDEEIARKAATDEAVISAMIEMGDTLWDVISFGGSAAGKAVGKVLGKEALELPAEKLAKALSKWVSEKTGRMIAKELVLFTGSIVSESVEEGLQGAVSIANRGRTISGRGGSLIGGTADVIGRTVRDTVNGGEASDNTKEIWEQMRGGAVIAMLGGGLRTGASVVAIAGDSVITHADLTRAGEQIRNTYRDQDLIAAVKDHASRGSEVYKLAEKLEAKVLAGEEVAPHEIGRLGVLAQEDAKTFRAQQQQDEVLDQLTENEDLAVQEYAEVQQVNPNVKVVSPYAQQLMDAGMTPELAVEQSALIEKAVAGQKLTDAEQKKLQLGKESVRQVFVQATGVEVTDAQSRNGKDRRQVFKNAQETARARAEAAATAAADTTDTTDTAAHPFAAESEPAQFTPESAPVERDAVVQVMNDIISGAEPDLRYADGTTQSEQEFAEQYRRINPEATAEEVSAAYQDRRRLNEAGKAIPGTARRAEARKSVDPGSVEDAGKSWDIYTGETLSENAQKASTAMTLAELNRIAGKFGVKAEIREADGKSLGSRENGYYDARTKTIVLNSNRATSQYLLTRYFVHELTHHGQAVDGDADAGLTADIIGAMKKIYGEDKVDQLIKDTRATYENHFKATGKDASVVNQKNYIEDEVASDFMMKAVGNRALLDRLAGVNKKPLKALIQKAKAFVSGKKDTDIGVKEAQRLIDRMQKAMAAAKKNSAKGVENQDAKAYTDSENKTDNSVRLSVDKLIGGTFPPYNVSQSDTNEHATRWAHREDVKSGDEKLFSYHGSWYLVEAFDSADMGYQIVDKLTEKQYESYLKEKREDGNVSRVQEDLSQLSELDREREWAGGSERRTDPAQAGQRGENLEVRPMGKEQNEGRQTASYRNGDLQSGRAGGEVNANSSKRYSLSAEESEQRIRWLRDERKDIGEQLDDPFSNLSASGRKILNNRLAKVDHEISKLVAEERRAAVKTPYQTILENLSAYRASDLESLAEQISDGNWDYEDLSVEELREGLRDTIEERIADLTPLEAQSSKFGLFVRPVKPNESSSLSTETRKDLDKQDLTVYSGVVVNKDLAKLMDREGYVTPNDRDYIRLSVETEPAWRENYLQNNSGEDAKRVAGVVQRFTERMIQNDAVYNYVPTGQYAYSKFGPLRGNQEYIYTFDMDTSCPRTFQFLNYRNALRRIAGRELDYNESVNLLELMRAYGQQIPCAYCYVENKRVLLSASYNRFFTYRQGVLSAATEADARKKMYSYNEKTGKISAAAKKVFDVWRKDPSYNPSVEEVWTATNEARNGVLNFLDAEKKSGRLSENSSKSELQRAVAEKYGISNLNSMEAREVDGFIDDWVYSVKAGQEHIYSIPNSEVVPDSIDLRALRLHREAMTYSKSVSSAKSVENYVPYTDQLKNVSPEHKAFIIGMGGIRKHSSNDFRMDYVQDYIMFYADLAAGKWTSHTYTKSIDFAKVFGRTGDRINLSIAFLGDSKENLRQNLAEGAPWREVRDLRKTYKDVGSMAMVTNDAQLTYALNADWIDMIIPFHASGLDKAVWYNLRMWNDYTSKQSERFLNADDMKAELAEAGVAFDKSAKANVIRKLYNKTFGIKQVYAKNKQGKTVLHKPHFFPGDTYVDGQLIPGHHNDVDRYFELCHEYGVKPRFAGIKVETADGRTVDVTEHPGYIKLIKETSRIDTEQKPIEFNLDQHDEFLGMSPLDYAFQRMEEEAKNGGFENNKEDPYGIVKEFAEEYLGQNRPLGYLTERAKETREVLEKGYQEMAYDAQGQIAGDESAGKRWSIDAYTGYEEGSIQDKVMKLLKAGSPEEAQQVLEKWMKDAESGTVEIKPEEQSIAERFLMYKPVTAEEAEANRAKLDKLIEKYGKIPTGEKAARPAPFAKKVGHLEGVSNHARTVAEFAGTPEWFKEEVEKAVVDKRSGFTYEIATDAAAMDYVERLRETDYNSLQNQWSAVVSNDKGRVSKNDIALGEYLYTQAIRQGDVTGAMKLVSELCAIGTQAGRTVQAMSLLKKMTPAGQLYYLQKAVDRLNEKNAKKPLRKTGEERRQLDDLTKQQEDAERELEKAEEDYTEALEALRKIKATLEDARDVNSAVRKANTETKRAQTQIKRILDAIEKVDSEVLLSEFEGVQGQLEEVKALEREVRSAERQTEAAKKRLAEKDVQAIRKKAIATKEELNKVRALEEDARKAEAELRRAEKQLQAAKERQGKYDTASTKAKLAETKEQIEFYRELLKEAKQLEAQLGRAEVQLDKLTTDWESKAEDRAKVAADFAAVQDAIHSLRQEKADFRALKSALKRANATLERLNTEWVKVKPQREQTAAQLEAARKRVEEAKAAKASALGKLNEIKRAVSRLNKEIEDRNAERIIGKRAPTIMIDTNLAEALLNAKTETDMQKAREALLQNIADQVPVTWAEKWNAWRYLAMLGNPKTHVRNLFSNAVFQPVVFMKDAFSALGEAAFMHGEQKKNRTKHLGQVMTSAVYGISPFGKARIKIGKYVRFADQDYPNMKEILAGGGKHNVADEIRDKRSIFGKKGLGKAMEGLSQFNSKALEVEDAIALRTHYVRALSQYLAAHKADVNALNGSALLDKARSYAVLEAQKATFREASALATSLNRLEKSGIAGQLLVGGLLPFKKTPINILKRGAEYSPLGIIKTVNDAVKSREDASKFIDSLSATVTGTAIMGVGFYLAAQGLLRAGGSDDERERKFEEVWGEQSYSLVLRDGRSYTIDWMAPAALPLFVGVEWYNMRRGQEDGELTLVDFTDALTMLSGPMFQLSMLDGLSKTLKSAGYGENPIPQVGMSVLTSYFGQALPTLWGQINRAFTDDTSRGTFIQSGTRLQAFQRAYQTSVLGKIPGLSDERVPYLDAWGRAETQANLLMRVFENFLSPGYYSKVERSPMEEELLRLYEVTGDGGVLPNTVSKYFNVGDERYNLTADEWVTYQVTTGQMAYNLITELVNSAGYAELTDAEKAKAINSLYDYASEKGRAAAVKEYTIDTAWIEKAEGLLEKGISLTDFVAISARDKESDGTTTEDLLGMTWLTDEDRANFISADYGKKLSDEGTIADPDKSYYEYLLTTTQQEEYLQHFDEQWMQDYVTLVHSDYFKGASLTDQAQMINDTRNQCADITQKWMAKKLSGAGVESQQVADFDTRALRNCTAKDELTRLYDLTGETKVLPKEMSREFSDNSLNAEQWLAAQEVKEDTANEILSRTTDAELYKQLTDEQRVNLIGKIHTYSTEMGKEAAGVQYESDEVLKVKDLEAKGVSVERYYAAAVLCNETSGGDTLDLVNMDWLTDDERAWIVASKYSKSLEGGNTFTDKTKKKHQFVMTDEQAEQYLARFDELFLPAYRAMTSSWKYQRGDAEARAELIDDLKADVCNTVKKEFSNYLPTVGNHSVPKE